MFNRYRIVKAKGYNNVYKVEKKCIFFFWTYMWQARSLEEAEELIEEYIKQDIIRKNNPKNTVVRTYKVD